MKSKHFILGALFILALLAISGCGGSKNNSLAPFQPQINNMPDNFQLQATGVNNVTSTLNYTWQNTGTSANVNQSCVISAGSATLVILDNNGTQVYSNNLSANGTFPTSTGVTGNWTIRVTLTSNSGDLNFRAQKP